MENDKKETQLEELIEKELKETLQEIVKTLTSEQLVYLEDLICKEIRRRIYGGNRQY